VDVLKFSSANILRIRAERDVDKEATPVASSMGNKLQ
jgi:hypothetical protein